MILGSEKPEIKSWLCAPICYAILGKLLIIIHFMASVIDLYTFVKQLTPSKHSTMIGFFVMSPHLSHQIMAQVQNSLQLNSSKVRHIR